MDAHDLRFSEGGLDIEESDVGIDEFVGNANGNGEDTDVDVDDVVSV